MPRTVPACSQVRTLALKETETEFAVTILIQMKIHVMTVTTCGANTSAARELKSLLYFTHLESHHDVLGAMRLVGDEHCLVNAAAAVGGKCCSTRRQQPTMQGIALCNGQ